MYIPSPPLTHPSPSSQTFVWSRSPSPSITTGKKIPPTTPSLKSRSDSISLPCEPTSSLLRQHFAHNNALIKAQNLKILNLELDTSDLLLTNANLTHQKQGLRYDNKTLEVEVTMLQQDVKHLAK